MTDVLPSYLLAAGLGAVGFLLFSINREVSNRVIKDRVIKDRKYQNNGEQAVIDQKDMALTGAIGAHNFQLLRVEPYMGRTLKYIYWLPETKQKMVTFRPLHKTVNHPR